MLGRPTIGNKPMTATERKQRQRALAKKARLPTHDHMIKALGKAVTDIAREQGMNKTLKEICSAAVVTLTAKQFDERRSTEALQRLMKGGGEN